MEGDIATFHQIASDFTLWLMPLFTASTVFVVVMLLKDMTTSFAKGIRFKFNPAFKEGDIVYLDGEEAIIVKIGVMETIFGIERESGYHWRYIQNERIASSRIEKIIRKHADK